MEQFSERANGSQSFYLVINSEVWPSLQNCLKLRQFDAEEGWAFPVPVGCPVQHGSSELVLFCGGQDLLTHAA